MASGVVARGKLHTKAGGKPQYPSSWYYYAQERHPRCYGIMTDWVDWFVSQVTSLCQHVRIKELDILECRHYCWYQH